MVNRKWMILGVVVLTITAVVVTLAVAAARDELPPAISGFESPELGGFLVEPLPLGVVLEGNVMIVEKSGGSVVACNPAQTDAASAAISCLFAVNLTGGGDLTTGRFYELRVVFETGGTRPGGTIIGAVSSAPLILGSDHATPSRFAEEREALGTWMAGHSLSGYLRADGIYVWWLPAEADTESRDFSELGRIRPVWVP